MEQEIELIKRAQEGDYQAIDQLLKEYRRHIKKWIIKYRFSRSFGLDQDDLEQISVCAFYNSLKNYDIDSKATLKTYAYNVVRFAVLSEIRNCQRELGQEGYLFLEDMFKQDRAGRRLSYEETIADNRVSNRKPTLVLEHSPQILLQQMYKDPINGSIVDLMVKGYTYHQISEILQIPIKEVYNRMYRMRKKAKVDSKVEL